MLTPHVKQNKPEFPYDRPLSYSQLSSFKWNPRQWYSRYVLGEESSTSPELIFGSYVDKKIQDDPKYLPQIKRLPHIQYKLECEHEGIKLVGLPDQLDLENPELRDTKTGRNPWDQKRADETKQLTMYLFMIQKIHDINSEKFKCYIDWLPTHIKKGKIALVDKKDVKIFETKRNVVDLYKFGVYLLETRQKMLDYYNKQ